MTGIQKYAPEVFLVLATTFAIIFGINYTPNMKAKQIDEIIFENPIVDEVTKKIDYSSAYTISDNELLDILNYSVHTDYPIIKSFTHTEPYEFDVIQDPNFNPEELCNYISTHISNDFIIVTVDSKDHELVRRIYNNEGIQMWPLNKTI